MDKWPFTACHRCRIIILKRYLIMDKSHKPIPQHINDFLDWLDVEKGLATKSQENYSRFIKKFTDWLVVSRLDKLLPHDLSPDHIWKYRVYLSRNPKKPLKRSSQNYYLIALRSLLNYFAERDILSLPSEKIKLAKDKSERQVRFLTLEHLKKLFEAPKTKSTDGKRDRAILETLFSTGLRVSELVSLNRDQIRSKVGTEELELSIVGKGNRVRTIYISERALYWIKSYLNEREDDDKALFASYDNRGKKYNRISPRTVQRMVKKYALKAGLPTFTTPHVMRHTFATDLLAQGVDLRIIQEFLGHKDIAATQIYTHTTSKKLREIHSKFHSGREL